MGGTMGDVSVFAAATVVAIVLVVIASVTLIVRALRGYVGEPGPAHLRASAPEKNGAAPDGVPADDA